MGLKNWLAASILKRNIKKKQKKSSIELNVDNLLADEMKNMTTTNRTIEKLLKVKIMRQETQHTLDKIGELNNEFEGESEDEDDGEEDFEESMKKMLFSKLLGNKKPVEDVSGLEGVVPQTPTEENPLVEGLSSLTPTEINKIKSKFLG